MAKDDDAKKRARVAEMVAAICLSTQAADRIGRAISVLAIKLAEDGCTEVSGALILISSPLPDGTQKAMLAAVTGCTCEQCLAAALYAVETAFANSRAERGADPVGHPVH